MDKNKRLAQLEKCAAERHEEPEAVEVVEVYVTGEDGTEELVEVLQVG